jgi:deoxyribonuclease V
MKEDLYKHTLMLLQQIPKGRVTTYKALAKALGNEKLVRVIGRILSQNKEPDKYPCYKVVYSNGKLGGYSLGIKEKIRRLKKDGIEVKNNKIVNFEKFLFDEF